MALTVASVRSHMRLENKKLVVVLVDFDNSYPTGGESFTPALIDGMSGFHEVIPLAHLGYVLQWDKTNAKLKVFQAVDPADAGGADTPLVEVGDTGDLSSLTDVPILVIGN